MTEQEMMDAILAIFPKAQIEEHFDGEIYINTGARIVNDSVALMEEES